MIKLENYIKKLVVRSFMNIDRCCDHPHFGFYSTLVSLVFKVIEIVKFHLK